MDQFTSKLIKSSTALSSALSAIFIICCCIHIAKTFETSELDVDKKYILLWEPPFVASTRPFKYFDVGNSVFKKSKCPHTNCYIHKNYQRLDKIRNDTNYDAILFNGKYLNKLTMDQLPRHRHPRQLYVFVQLEGADRFPVCPTYYDEFFNLTMTYRLDSDIPWPNFKVLTLIENATVAPEGAVDWMPYEEMDMLNENAKGRLETKKRIGAFISNCITAEIGLDKYVNSLSDRLVKLTRMPIDIFGGCQKSRRNKSKNRHPKLRKDYFFYLALENSYDRDFVSKKMYMAQVHNTVPVVYGGANYSKFGPPHSYINAQGLTPKKLAVVMATVMRKKYADYFRWRNHYFYVDNHDLRGVACKLCKRLNQGVIKRQHHASFRLWWNRRFEHYTTCGLIKRPYPIGQDYYKIMDVPRTYTEKAILHQIKTILLWHPSQAVQNLGLGNTIFKNYNCKYDNCFISSTPNLDIPMDKYDAVMISSFRKNSKILPKFGRTAKQLYIFAHHEPSEVSPICSADYNNYFNLTMTYRLDSDILWTYYDVMTPDNSVIGPKNDVMWIQHQYMEPISVELKMKLRKKHKLAVWFVRDCIDKKPSKYEMYSHVFSDYSNDTRSFVDKLNKELISLGSEPVDIYSECGPLKCPKADPLCEKLISDNYMFHLSFENYIDKDYVTDKLWRAYENYVVPIVFGGADYEKFAPPGSYINAMMLGPKQLAYMMVRLFVYDRNQYYDFFKWRKYYTIQDNYFKIGQNTACNLCATLNERKRPTLKKKFRSWWNEKWWSQCGKH